MPGAREEKLKEAIKAQYKSQREFSKQTGIPASTLSSMFKNGIGGTALDTLMRVCAALGMELRELAVSNEVSLAQNYSKKEQQLIADFRRLDSFGQEMVLCVLEKQLEHVPAASPEIIAIREPEERRNLRPIRLYQIAASAGTGNFLDGEEFDEVMVDDAVPASAEFGIRIQGDSMEPRIPNGSVVWIRPQQMLDDGDIGIFVLNGDSYCKRLMQTGSRARLVSLNKRYSDIQIGEYDELYVVGKVVGVEQTPAF
ncbi:MAG: helix-turn-helix domain-containing protein [Oscillospiraceae bacterium]|nr:helix-turn-helix domain-containing protein [Oscillospiraceae bacterium]